MTIKRVLLLCLGLIMITAVFFLFQKVNAPTAAELIQAEQEIYTLLLSAQKDAYSDVTDAIQVVEFTNSGELQFGGLDGGIFTEGPELGYFSGLEKRTLLDFQKKNSESHPIKNYLPDSATAILVNPAAGKQLYWWVSYSRIGFNPSMTQALVLVGDCRGTSCYDGTSDSMYSSGFYVFLEKESGEWVIKKRQDVWHSESEPH